MFKIMLNSPKTYEIKISLGDEEFFTDLYYYCLDNTFFNGDETIAKGLLNFVCMVENWKINIKKLEIGSSTALPFDFSDQYIGFFIVSKVDEQLSTIQSACSLAHQGWGVNPSQLNLVNFLDEPYEVGQASYTMPVQELLDSIEESMTTIFSGFYTR